MKKYKLVNLGCANCASQMEEKIAKLNGVSSAQINFMTSKLFIEYEESMESDILKQAQEIISKLEPACLLEVK